MGNCRVLHLEKNRGEDRMMTWNFAGNKPAVPPLMTEAVATVTYLVDDIDLKL